MSDMIPVYTTRPFGSNEVRGTFRVHWITAAVASKLVIANIVGWSAYGLVELAQKVI